MYPEVDAVLMTSVSWNGSAWINYNTNKVERNITWCSGNPQGTGNFLLLIITNKWNTRSFLFVGENVQK